MPSEHLQYIVPNPLKDYLFRCLSLGHMAFPGVKGLKVIFIMLTWSWGAYGTLKYPPFIDCKIVHLKSFKHKKVKVSWFRLSLDVDHIFQIDRPVLMFNMNNKRCSESLRVHLLEDPRYTSIIQKKTNLQIPRLDLEFSKKSSITLV